MRDRNETLRATYRGVARDRSVVVRHDADGFFIVLGGDPPENERKGTVCIVHVRGALTQFKGEGGDSYEAIVERVQGRAQRGPEAERDPVPHSSPGGVVAGLNETVFKLQRMSKEPACRSSSFVGEIAASADYALCCASSRVLCPPSGICGSIGVISTMVSASEADKKMGIDVPHHHERQAEGRRPPTLPITKTR